MFISTSSWENATIPYSSYVKCVRPRPKKTISIQLRSKVFIILNWGVQITHKKDSPSLCVIYRLYELKEWNVNIVEGCLKEVLIFDDTRMNTVVCFPPKKSCDAETDDDDMSVLSYNQNSENSENEMKGEIDLCASMIDDARIRGFLKTLQMDAQKEKKCN